MSISLCISHTAHTLSKVQHTRTLTITSTIAASSNASTAQPVMRCTTALISSSSTEICIHSSCGRGGRKFVREEGQRHAAVAANVFMNVCAQCVVFDITRNYFSSTAVKTHETTQKHAWHIIRLCARASVCPAYKMPNAKNTPDQCSQSGRRWPNRFRTEHRYVLVSVFCLRSITISGGGKAIYTSTAAAASGSR